MLKPRNCALKKARRNFRNRFAAASQFALGFVMIISPAGAQVRAASPSILTRVDQIRALSPQEAERGYAVRIRGVITMDAPSPDFFIQDASAGIYVEGSTSSRYPHVLGERVELEGVTGPGKFAPVVRELKLRVLGKGALPQARLFPFAQLDSGQQDSQWVRVRGTVRSVAVDRTSWSETTLALHIASVGGEFNARVPIAHVQDFSSWVDSEVLIEGVCGSLYSADRRLTGILFYVPRLSFIKIEAPAPEVPVTSLLLFAPGTGAAHRVRVRGVVEFQQQREALFLQVQGKGLRVLSKDNTRLAIGDLVDVVGFPAVGESAPIIEDAVLHRVGQASPPRPVPLELDQPWEQFDGALVTTEAKLLDRQQRPDGLTLLLQSGGVFFSATLPADSDYGNLVTVPLNSDVNLTGVCLVQSGGLWHTPQSFRMLLRSPGDVRVLRTPSWWNLRHTLWILAVTLGVLLFAFAWVVVLGRRVREQMRVIRQKLKHSAVLEERNRIARELHDNLEQELAGITMQLDLAADCFQQSPGLARQALNTARDMSRHSMVEARRSVWDLRCQMLEEGDLVFAIRQTVEPLATRENAQFEVSVLGTPSRLPGQIEMNLLRIAQEAAANAVKHGQARRVDITLEYGADSVSLAVADDGRGFAASETLPTGHFGMLDMRERAQSLQSQLIVESHPGRGTRVALEVPLRGMKSTDAELKANSYSRS
jgi:signal transduction histidine kinase